MDNKQLINRLSRIQGQIEALKGALHDDHSSEEKCLANLRLLKASINGLKKFGAAYMTNNVQNCINSKAKKQELESLMSLAIGTGFDL